jgi:uncharacterized protein YegL
MGRFIPLDNEEIMQVPGAGTFTFSAKKIDKLGALKYTVVTIAIDVSGSVSGFADELLACLKAIVTACKQNQRAEFIVIRVITFGTEIEEIHGFREFTDIEVDDYPALNPNGMTCLYDAAYDGIGSTIEYSRRMVEQGYDVNGAVYIITDGGENPGGGHITIASPKMIRDKIDDALRKEDIESIITTLVGLYDPNHNWASQTQNDLSTFQAEANLTKYIEVGEATPENLAKLADWVSGSVSSQSDQVGSNAPSQVPDF